MPTSRQRNKRNARRDYAQTTKYNLQVTTIIRVHYLSKTENKIEVYFQSIYIHVRNSHVKSPGTTIPLITLQNTKFLEARIYS